jgi:hypothetical protein
MKRQLPALAVLVAMLAMAVPVMRGADDEKPPETRKADEKAWVQIFNGKDLTGWRVYPRGTGNWKVVDGVLIGSKEQSHLFNEWCHYKNFRYRVEAMINDNGNSGQYSRAKFAPGFPPGYEAQINSTHSDPIRTGSLYPSFPVPRGEREKLIVRKQLHKPDEWFTQEVIAVGNHIVIKVNGKTTVDFVDKNNSYMEGHFALQQHDPGTVVKFRKIEVMELPDSK